MAVGFAVAAEQAKGVLRVDDRRVLIDIVWALRSGIPWRDELNVVRRALQVNDATPRKRWDIVLPSGPPSTFGGSRFRVWRWSGVAPPIVPILCSGRKAGVVVAFGLTADRDGPTDFPILLASGRFVICFGSADS